MPLHRDVIRKPGRLVLGMTMSAALAVTLAACSSSASTAKHLTAKKPAVAAPAASTPAASSAPAAAAAATGLSGTWNGQYSGAYQGTFILRWRQSISSLSGTIVLSPGGTQRIHGSVQGGDIRFGTVGSTAITYTGTVSGSSMSGSYQVHAANASGGQWSASKS